MRKIVQKIYHTHGTIFKYGPAAIAICKWLHSYIQQIVNCKYLIIHSPQGFSWIIYTG